MALPTKPCLKHQDYTIGWICVLIEELVAAKFMLDEEHEELPVDKSDSNTYIFGRIGKHNIVIASLPSGADGTNPAARVATQMQRSFDLRFSLLVGVGGGIPNLMTSKRVDIRLGDVVVSNPTDDSGGVIQYDHARSLEGEQWPKRKGILNKPPEAILTAVMVLRARHEMQGFSLEKQIPPMYLQHPRLASEYSYQGSDNDVLFDARYKCEGQDDSCVKCRKKQDKVLPREIRKTKAPQIHYGCIASGNLVVKNSVFRDYWMEEAGALCFEMEAAGLMDWFQCLVIRGIYNYADSHKNKIWQPYAAITAAAYAKDLLSAIAPISMQPAEMSVELQRNLAGNFGRNVYWTVPRSSNKLFTGRADILEKLQLAFTPTSPSQVFGVRQRRFVISGDGGIGKSEVCLKFAEDKGHCFWGIFWIDASTQDAAKQTFVNVGKLCGQSLDTFEQVKMWLANVRQPWLLIIDNADDPDVDYALYFPSGTNGNLVLTTRNPQCACHATDEINFFERMDNLGLENATKLLSKATSILENAWEKRKKAAENVVQVLGLHTLAIIQAGAYIKHGFCSLEDYPAQYETQQERLLKYYPKQAQSTHGSVFATFEISATRMERSEDQDAKDALKLLRIFAFLHFQDIQEMMFRRAWEEATQIHKLIDKGEPLDKIWHLSGSHLSYMPFFSKEGSRVTVEDFSWHESLNLLESYSLIKFSNSPERTNFSMHPLAHTWARLRMNLEQKETGLMTAGSIIALSMHGFEPQTFWYMLLAHVRAFVTHCIADGIIKKPTMESCQTFYCICWLLHHVNEDRRFGELLQYLRDSEAWKCVDKEYSWEIQWLTAINYQQLRQSSTALELLEQVVELQKRSLKPNIGLLLKYQHSLALTYADLEKYEQAEELLEHSIEVKESRFGYENNDSLNARHELAKIYQLKGHVEKAVKLFEQILEIRERTLEPEHPDRLSTQHELASAYMLLKTPEYTKAAEILEKVVDIRTRILEPEHTERLASQHQLARAYEGTDRPEKAVEILEEVVDIRARILEPENPHRLASQHELARAYVGTNRPEKAVEILEEVVDIQARILEPENFNRLDSQHELARAYISFGRPEKAVKLLEKVVDIRTRILEPENPDRLTSQHNLAVAYMGMDPPCNKPAAELLEHVVSIQRKTLSLEDPILVNSQHNLAVAYMGMDPPCNKPAAELLEHVVRIKRKILKPDDPDRLISERRLRKVQACMESESEPQSKPTIEEIYSDEEWETDDEKTLSDNEEAT